MQSSADEDDGSSDASTRPSIFGGGPSGSSGTAADVQLQQRSAPASGTPETPLSQTPSKAAGSVNPSWGAGDQRGDQSEQHQDSYYYSEEYEQQSSAAAEKGQDGGSAGWEKQTTGEYEVPSVPWST